MVETPVKSGFLRTEGGGGQILDFRGGGGGEEPFKFEIHIYSVIC